MAESMLKDIGIYKDIIISNLISDDILELLLGKNYTEKQAANVVYSQIFPFLYTEDVQTETKSYIGIDIVPEESTRKVKNMTLVIWAYCHKDIMRYSKTGYRGNRADILSDMIDRKIRNLDNLGIGLLEFKKAPYFMPQTKFYGRQITYSIPDFKVKEV